jgi:predicted metal-dependent phosphotriesterase family hydrolase
MERRAFLATVAGAAAARFARRAAAASAVDTGRILSVRGPVEPEDLGITLVHEHVLVDFVGADRISPDRYDAEEVFRTALPHLVALRERGCRALFEATPAYLGRDPLLLRRLSEASGLHLVTNTGYYGFGGGKHLPHHAHVESPRQLSDRWTREFRRGIGGTGVRPGFLKIGVHAGPLSDIDRKLVEAGALCHLDTGLTIAVHTGDGTAALDILATLRRSGVSPEAWVWVHAQNAGDRPTQDWAARQGAWLELDGVGWGPIEGYVNAVVELKHRGRLDRVLVSQDAGWYHVGETGGGTYRPYTAVFDELVPALRARGLSEEDVRTLLVDNPARAFAIGVKRLEPSSPPRS